MKFSLFNNFGALNSVPVFAAFQEGLNNLGIEWNRHDMSADVAVIWSVVWAGRMKQNQAVWDHFRSQGKPVVVLEVGMLQRGQTWKVGLNGTGLSAYPTHELDSTRPNRLGLTLKPWNSQGSDIVIAMQRHDSEQWYGQPPVDHWLFQTVNTIRKVSNRPIVIRSHPRQEVLVLPDCTLDRPIHMPNTYDDFDFHRALSNAWAVINWNSGPGSQAVMNGIPAFVGPNSLASPVANLDLLQIENPSKPNRDEWLTRISHTEWSINEISSGIPIKRLLPMLD